MWHTKQSVQLFSSSLSRYNIRTSTSHSTSSHHEWELRIVQILHICFHRSYRQHCVFYNGFPLCPYVCVCHKVTRAASFFWLGLVTLRSC